MTGRIGQTLAAAGIAMAVLCGVAATQQAHAQHVVTENEAGKLSFDALTAAPARHYVQPVQYYGHRRYLPPRRHHRYIPRRHYYRHHR